MILQPDATPNSLRTRNKTPLTYTDLSALNGQILRKLVVLWVHGETGHTTPVTITILHQQRSNAGLTDRTNTGRLIPIRYAVG